MHLEYLVSGFHPTHRPGLAKHMLYLIVTTEG